jgi:amino acid adenylation domain-containing protein
MLDAMPLDDREEALWMLQRLFPEDGVSNIAIAFTLLTEVNLEVLQKSVLWVIRLHPMLRSVVRVVDGRAVRVFRTPTSVNATISVHASTRTSLDADMLVQVRRAFDIERDELARFSIFELPDGGRILLVVIHHIAFDAPSIPRFLEDLASAYHGYIATGEFSDIAPVPTSALQPVEASQESLNYWSSRLPDMRPGAMLLDVTDYASAPASFIGKRYERPMSPSVSSALRKLRQYKQTTDNIVLLAAYLLLLLRHGAGPDLVVGIPLSLRSEDQSDSVGCYFSTVPLAVQADPRISFAELVERTHDNYMAAFKHRDFSYESMIRRFRHDDFDWQAPVFRHLFNFLPSAPEPKNTARHYLIERAWQIDGGYSRYDLEFVLRSRRQGHELQIAYRQDLHDAGFIRRLYDKYETLLLSAAADPECEVGRLPMTTDHDMTIDLANRTSTRWRGPQTVAGMIDTQIGARAQHAALATTTETISYRALGQLTDRISARLAAGGVRAGDLVAVVAARGRDSAAAILATWRVGAAYLPLDPAHPAARLRFELQDAGVTAIVADGETLQRFSDSAKLLISTEDLASASLAGEVTGQPAGSPVPRREPDPDSVAYVIYTSGSTGKPKGVRITHSNLANVVRHFGSTLDFDLHTKMLWLTTLAFDISALEFMLPLSFGGTTVVADDQARVKPELLLEIITKFDVDIIQATPTIWRMITGKGHVDLTGRRLLCGGEPLSRGLAQQLLTTGAQLINVYGPTETTIWSTAEPVTHGFEGDPVVGRPIANTTVAVVDEFGADCPVDVVGQVVIGGTGVGAGYLRRSDLTAARFIRHEKIGRGFLTGDLGRWRPDGRLALHGRADRQVKVHGGRLELDEVESVLELHPMVKSAAVVLHRPGQVAEALAAFVVPAGEVELNDLRDFAAQQLPAYAVPSIITLVGALPANASGKTDYARLAEVDSAARPVTPAPDVQPHADEVTAWLIGVWRNRLGDPALHQDSNLFLSGGQSLIAIAITDQVREHYGVDLADLAIFKYPTPRRLAAEVKALQPVITARDHRDDPSGETT